MGKVPCLMGFPHAADHGRRVLSPTPACVRGDSQGIYPRLAHFQELFMFQTIPDPVQDSCHSVAEGQKNLVKGTAKQSLSFCCKEQLLIVHSMLASVSNP